MRRGLVVAIMGALALGLACGETLVAPDDGDVAGDAGIDTTPTPSTDAGADAVDDATQSDAGDALVPTGPCPSGPNTSSCSPNACAKRRLHAPSQAEYPFDIVTDAQFVYWIAQRIGGPGFIDPYNGNGVGVLQRTDRTSKTVAGDVLVANLRLAQGVTVAGKYVYYAYNAPTDAGGAGSARIDRVERTCTPPCSAEKIFDLESPQRVLRLMRVDDETLIAFMGDGILWRLDLKPGASPPKVMVAPGDPSRTLTTTSAHAYFGSVSSTALVRRVGPAPATPADFALIPDAGGGVGGRLATDCTNVWAYQHPVLLRSSIASPGFVGAFEAGITDVYDVMADTKYVYFAAANAGGGIFALRNQSGAVERVYDGNVFRAAVDDVGVYWGEHGLGSPGAIEMMVK